MNTEGTLQLPYQVHAKAMSILQPLLLMDCWPDDDWHSLGDDWDMNVYISMTGLPAAVVYAVVDGQADTSRIAHVFEAERR